MSKRRAPLTILLAANLHDELDGYADAQGVDASAIADVAIRNYLDAAKIAPGRLSISLPGSLQKALFDISLEQHSTVTEVAVAALSQFATRYASTPLALSPLDPTTLRCVTAMHDVAEKLESGSPTAGLTAFSDSSSADQSGTAARRVLTIEIMELPKGRT